MFGTVWKLKIAKEMKKNKTTQIHDYCINILSIDNRYAKEEYELLYKSPTVSWKSPKYKVCVQESNIKKICSLSIERNLRLWGASLRVENSKNNENWRLTMFGKVDKDLARTLWRQSQKNRKKNPTTRVPKITRVPQEGGWCRGGNRYVDGWEGFL